MDVYATHLQPLVRSALETEGPILELGCGDYSTPVLSEIARFQRRYFKIQASDAAWLHRFAEFGEIEFVADWNKWTPPTPQDAKEWGMVFLDSEQGTAGRIERLPALLPVAPVVLLHDAQGAVVRPRWRECTKGWDVEILRRYANWTAILRRL